MNLVQMLLDSEIENIERPSKVVEIKRLSKVFGFKFELLIKALTYDKYNEIQDNNLKMDVATQKVDFNINNLNLELILDGCFNVEDGTRFFSNKELLKKFKVHTHKDLIKKLLSGGEISKLSDEITAISGFKGEVIEDVKGL